jgi:hypothetical protein
MLAIIISAVAAAGAVGNFFYTQWRTDQRDITKWQREELQKLTANILQLSASRQSALNEAYEAYESGFRRFIDESDTTASSNRVGEMELVVEQIRLLDDRVAECASAVWKAHSSAEWDYQMSEQTDPMSEIELLAAEGLGDLHSALISAFREETGLQKKPKKWAVISSQKKALDGPRRIAAPPT